MSQQTITFDVPTSLYNQLKQRADQASRTVEDELLDVLAATVPERLPDEISKAIASLALLDDDALWRVARNHMPVDLAEQLESLHLKRQRDGLTDAEAQQSSELVRQYERAMLLRAQAAALLNERGQHISQLARP